MKKILTSTIILLFTFTTNLLAQSVSADFIANKTQSCQPAIISFTNNSVAPSGATYQWSFGNGDFSTEFEPQIIYTQSGFYSVQLIVVAGNVSDTLTRQNYIEVFEPFQPSFTILEDTVGCAPFNIHFVENTNSTQNQINYWHWDFGDGTVSNLQNPVHTFIYQSQFTISLFVIDTKGCQGLITHENMFSIFKPSANFSATDTSSCTGQLNTQFLALSTDTLIYNWDFGDGQTSTTANPVHLYTTPGNFTPKLIVTDTHNCKDTITKNDYIKIQQSSTSFTIPSDTTCKAQNIHFTNTTTDANYYLWDFGDGTTSTSTNPDHQYNTDGSFTVTLTANSYICQSSFSKTITMESVTAGFTFDKNYFCEIPAIVHYTNTSVNAVSYFWDLKDSLTSTDVNPEIKYYAQGYSSTSLTAYSKHGCKDVFTADSCVEVRIPRAYFTPNDWVNRDKIEGCLPNVVNFQNVSIYNSDKDSIVTFAWDFGTGEQSNQENPIYTYNLQGAFGITFTITTAKGCVSNYYATAEAGVAQVADFSSNFTGTICASQEISFTNASTIMDSISQFYWKFGDGETSSKTNPSHVFLDTGYMSVKLLVYNHGCPSRRLKDSLFYVSGPVAKLQEVYNCDNPYEVLFQNLTLAGDTYNWQFGDNSTSEQPELTHIYAKRGDYAVKLTAVNNETGCTFTTQKNVFIREPKAAFEMDDSIGCVGLVTQFNPRISQDQLFFDFNGTTGRYLWNFGDGTSSIMSPDSVSHSFIKKGTFNVKLKITDMHNCADSIYKKVHIFQPTIKFDATNLEDCLPLTVDFIDQTTSDTLLVSYLWNFGDGYTATEQNPTHIYTKRGDFDVKLTVTDTIGCQNSFLVADYIDTEQPNPLFTTNDRSVCVNDTLVFNLLDNHEVVSYSWDLGNGTSSDSSFASTTYNTAGTYGVQVFVIDKYGCDSSLFVPNFITVQAYPNPIFVADETVSTCYPLVVNFTNQTNNPEVNHWFWDFGDDFGTSFLKNPIHTFVKPGNFNVEITETTTFGCSTTFSKNQYINVGGPYADIVSQDTICKSISTQLKAINPINIFQMQWFTGDGNVYLGDVLNYNYKTVGTKYPVLLLTSDDKHTCDKFFTDTLYIHGINTQIDSANSLMAGCVPLNAKMLSVSDSATQWNWDFANGQTSTAEVAQNTFNSAGVYNVQLIATSNFGCHDTAYAEVNVFRLPVPNASKDTLICQDTQAQLLASDGVQYTWSPAETLDDENSPNPIATPLHSTLYLVEVTDSNQCQNKDSVLVSVYEKPLINLGDTTVIIGEPIQWTIDDTQIETINWQPTDGLSCNDCFSPLITALEPTNYTITYTDKKGCFVLTKDIYIDVVKAYTIDVPNAFTPNGDGVNDVIYVKGWGVKQLVYFRIFNRFGEMVFETNNYKQGWDGTYKGNRQNVETYTYIAITKGYDGNLRTKRGTIKLLR